MRVGSARVGARAEQQLHGRRAAVVARQVERGTPRSACGALEERTRLETQGCSLETWGCRLWGHRVAAASAWDWS